MGKRYVDTGLNKEPWFRKLKPKLKCAVRFLFDECNNAGVWVIDMESMSFFVGEEILLDDLFAYVNNGKSNRIEMFQGDKIFIPGFTAFQYGELTKNCKPHIPIIALLKKYGLYERVSKGYTKPILTLEEKEKEEEEEKEKDKTEIPKSELPNPLLPQMSGMFLQRFPNYPEDKENDYPALLEISYKIGKALHLKKESVTGDKREIVSRRWGEIVDFIRGDDWFSKKDIRFLNKHFQSVIQGFEASKPKGVEPSEVQKQLQQREKQNEKLKEKYA